MSQLMIRFIGATVGGLFDKAASTAQIVATAPQKVADLYRATQTPQNTATKLIPEGRLASDTAFHRMLALTLNRRCDYYDPQHSGDYSKAVWTFIHEILDPRAVSLEGHVYGIVFPQLLRNILDTSEAQNLITEAHQALKSGQPFSLWEHALKAANNDRSKAIEFMALLFQDIDKLSHIEVLKSLASDDRKLKLVYDLKDLCQAIHDQDVQHPTISLYPSPDGNQMPPTSALYHFYVPALAALRLRASGFSTTETRAVPVIFNTVYEYFRHSALDGHTAVPSSMGGLFKPGIWANLQTVREVLLPRDPSPERIEEVLQGRRFSHEAVPEMPKPQDFLADTYLAFAGVFYALDLDGLTYEGFCTEFTSHAGPLISRELFDVVTPYE